MFSSNIWCCAKQMYKNHGFALFCLISWLYDTKKPIKRPVKLGDWEMYLYCLVHMDHRLLSHVFCSHDMYCRSKDALARGSR